MSLKALLGTTGYWAVNKKLVREIGLVPTALLQHLIDLEEVLLGQDFWQQQSRICDELNLSEYEVRKATGVLKEKGFVKVVKKGLPPRNHYTINSENITTFFTNVGQNFSPTSVQIFDDLEEHSKKDVCTTHEETSKAVSSKRKKSSRKKSTMDEAIDGLAQATEKKAQARLEKEIGLALWNELLSVWKTNEFPQKLESVRRSKWSYFTNEERQEIVDMVKSFGKDIVHLSKIWISETLLNGNMNKEYLQSVLLEKKPKSKSAPLKKPNSESIYRAEDYQDL